MPPAPPRAPPRAGPSAAAPRRATFGRALRAPGLGARARRHGAPAASPLVGGASAAGSLAASCAPSRARRSAGRSSARNAATPHGRPAWLRCAFSGVAAGQPRVAAARLSPSTAADDCEATAVAAAHAEFVAAAASRRKFAGVRRRRGQRQRRRRALTPAIRARGRGGATTRSSCHRGRYEAQRAGRQRARRRRGPPPRPPHLLPGAGERARDALAHAREHAAPTPSACASRPLALGAARRARADAAALGRAGRELGEAIVAVARGAVLAAMTSAHFLGECARCCLGRRCRELLRSLSRRRRATGASCTSATGVAFSDVCRPILLPLCRTKPPRTRSSHGTRSTRTVGAPGCSRGRAP